MNKAMDAHEGCNIYGWLDLQRVAGNLRISVHIEDFFQLAKESLHPPACRLEECGSAVLLSGSH